MCEPVVHRNRGVQTSLNWHLGTLYVTHDALAITWHSFQKRGIAILLLFVIETRSERFKRLSGVPALGYTSFRLSFMFDCCFSPWPFRSVTDILLPFFFSTSLASVRSRVRSRGSAGRNRKLMAINIK